MLFTAASSILSFFFFNDTATTEIYTLSLHDALPICRRSRPSSTSSRPCERRLAARISTRRADVGAATRRAARARDRKSTRLNSSHSQISYAVFCLKKKKNNEDTNMRDLIYLYDRRQT